jgi:hypothetical protein
VFGKECRHRPKDHGDQYRRKHQKKYFGQQPDKRCTRTDCEYDQDATHEDAVGD